MASDSDSDSDFDNGDAGLLLSSTSSSETTNVLLGYVSREPDEEEDDVISRLGGRPAWIDPVSPPSYALATCKVCAGPTALLLQLNGELPERFPGHERRLYVLSCRRPSCRRQQGCVRVLRATRVSREVADAAEAGKLERAEEARKEAAAAGRRKEEAEREWAGLGDALFGGSGLGGGAGDDAHNPFSAPASANPKNPFSGVSNISPQAAAGSLAAATTAEPATAIVTTALPQTFAEVLTLGQGEEKDDGGGGGGPHTNATAAASQPAPAPRPWPQDESALAPAYPTLYLVEAAYEALDPKPEEPVPEAARAFSDGGNVGVDVGAGMEDEHDTFESTLDRTFQRFAGRVAQNPEQVIRYEFGGRPLLYSRDDSVGRRFAAAAVAKRGAADDTGPMPRCAACGASRTFEVQLTPHAITELEADEAGMDGMEWGTVIVGVCERDCVPGGTADGQVGYVEEWVGVQWEEVVSRKQI